MSELLDEQLLGFLSDDSNSPSDATRLQPAELPERVQNASEEAVRAILETLCETHEDEWKTSVTTVAPMLVGVIRRGVELGNALDSLGRVCQQLDGCPALQTLLLRLLVSATDERATRLFAELIVDIPQLETRSYVEIFGDLLRRENRHISPLFPTILGGLEKPALASFVLDFANYAFRNKFVDHHPAADRFTELCSLLSTLSERLQKLQDDPPKTEEETVLLGKRVTESVALGIALCDALACIGNEDAVASLNKALQVEHRRLRVEAAAALAKLGVEDAKKLLTAMAAEPIERLRVLHYAEELDLIDEVDEEFSNIVARAEAEFVMFLAQPTHFGIAPQHIELVDQRELAWPGYESPRNCFLFQYVYAFPEGEFTNIGIAGPVVMAFEADLTALHQDDIYAIFAGWHVDHPDIFVTDVNRVVGEDALKLDRMRSSLVDSFEDVTPVAFGTLFERRVLIAAAERKEENGWAIVGEDSVTWVPLGNPARPIGSAEAFHLFVGRSLLKSFN